MKTHAQLGSEAIELAEQDAARSVEFLSGQGNRPLASRKMGWNGLSRRPRWRGYPGFGPHHGAGGCVRCPDFPPCLQAPHASRVKFKTSLQSGRGRHFDPDMADAFLAHFSDFCDIADSIAIPIPD